MFHRLQTKKAPAGQESVFLVSDRCFPQTIDVLRGARRTARHPARDRRPGGVADWTGAFGAAAAVSGRPRRGRRSRADHRARARCRPAGGGRQRSDGADAADAARRDGRGRGGRQLAAIRRAARVRRTARGVLCDARIVRPSGARPDHRDLGRCARPSGVPHGAADARATHPPREGDLEHLHGAGAARQHRGDVRGVSWAGGIARRSRSGSTASRASLEARADRRSGCRQTNRALLRHAADRRRDVGVAVRAARSGAGSISATSATAPSASPSTKRRPIEDVRTSSTCSRAAGPRAAPAIIASTTRRSA